MYTKLEDLVTELWLEIFPYLNIHDQFKALYNLNTRLNQILLLYRTKISCKSDDKTTECLFKYILPFQINRTNVSTLKLERTKRVRKMLNKIKLFLLFFYTYLD